MMMSEIAGAALEPFWAAELDYRRERALRGVRRRPGGRSRHRLHLPKRPTMRLPHRKPGVVAVA
jgi:hypothetical protein